MSITNITGEKRARGEMAELTEEDILMLTDDTLHFMDSTLRKHQWVQPIYEKLMEKCR